MHAVSAERSSEAARVAALAEQVRRLEEQLAAARTELPVPVDFSDLDAAGASAVSRTDALHSRVRHDPRDVEALRQLHWSATEPDHRWCIAQALTFLGAAGEAERRDFLAGRRDEVVHPQRALDADDWALLRHPDEHSVTGEIFGLIVSPVLLGHVSARRRAGTLPALEPERWLDPRTSQLAAARCFGWAADVLATSAPLLYSDPHLGGLVALAPGVPPALRLGAATFADRKPKELAFLAGRYIALMQRERFVHLLFPEVADLQDLFLAALTLGRPDLPLPGASRDRVHALANAIHRFLEPGDLDALRHAFAHFVEDGGRTELQRWAGATERTAARVGLLLADDLWAAETMLELGQTPRHEAILEDLVAFSSSQAYAELRRRIGIHRE